MGLLHFMVKYVLFILNLIFTVLGVAIIVLGVLIRTKLKNLSDTYFDDLFKEQELEASLQMLSIVIIILGTILFVIAFSGCCGAITETKCLLISFAVSMFLLLTVKIYLTVTWNKEINFFRHTLEDLMNEKFDDPANNVTFHVIEASFHCCGTTGPESYEILPPTCCSQKENIIIESECLLEDAFSIGCLQLIDNYIANIAHTVKTVLIWVIVFEALEFIGAVYLSTSTAMKSPKP